MKKIVIAQYWTSNLSYSKYTEEINKNYCDEKGYIYHCENDDSKIINNLNKRAITWYKPLFILDVFKKYDPDYVLFLDADAIVCDKSYNVEDFIDENYEIICTEDHGPSKINAGVFILKNSDWTKYFMNLWWYSCDRIQGGTNNILGYYANALWHDQTCFGYLLEENSEYNKHVKVISNHVLNGREFKNKISKNFIFHAFSYGHLKNRKLDLAYYDIFDIKPDIVVDDLTEMSKLYDTDKQYEHNYFELVYNDLFVPLKNKIKKFMEIGGITNGNSKLLWRDFFTDAEIYVADKNAKNYEELKEIKNTDRLNFVDFDQSNLNDVEDFSKQNFDFDIILDDGSHKMQDQQITFAKLFKSLKSGGIYIIEDLHTSLEVVLPEKRIFGWGDPEKTITLEMLKKYNETKKIYSDYMTYDEMEYLNQNIEKIEIYQSRPEWSITGIILKK